MAVGAVRGLESAQHNARATLSGVEGLRLLGAWAQLGLLVLLIREFHLESRTFYHIAILTFVGFVIHSLLPFRYRLQFFATLCLAGIGVAFGIGGGAWLVGIGLALIAICHLPVAFWARVAILCLAGVALAIMRVGWLSAPWPLSIWPILGSMFMFRLALYLYTLKHRDAPLSIPRTLSYFFLLPNVCFPLFPVVDYKTFTRTYYDDEPHRIYQTGLNWMLRGMIHLILYRYVYTHLLDPLQVVTLRQLVRYLLTTFLLYLRVSGQFHLIVGMLYLFGFCLPETHHFYFLASSFTDFWRRINIYWKDFMMKLVYYPSFFLLRRWGSTTALVASTLVVFMATWLLHSYQWFWLLGNFPVSAEDGLFWGILAIMVLANSLHEARKGRQRILGKRGWSLARAFRTVGTFSVICVLWSLWSSDSLAEWLSLWSAARRVEPADVALIGALLATGLMIGGKAWGAPAAGGQGDSEGRRPIFRSSTPLTVGALLILTFFGSPAVRTMFDFPARSVMASLQESTLNTADAALMQRGYYEKLNRVNRFSTQLWEVYASRPVGLDVIEMTGPYHDRNDFMLRELIPSVRLVFKKNSFRTNSWSFRTNKWGMRDQEYEQRKPPNTYRMALLGPSDVMGGGVADGETFESVLEERLNREKRGKPYARYEILNFGVGDFSLLQQMVMLEERAVAFQPDVVIVTLHPNENRKVIAHLTKAIQQGFPIPHEDLRAIVRKAGVDSSMAPREIERGLRSFSDEVLGWTLRHIAQDCRDRGVVPVAMALRLPTTRPPREVRALRVAEEAGFLVLNLFDVYGNRDENTLRLAEWDSHPNAEAHRIIADRLFDEIWRHEAALRLSAPAHKMALNDNEEAPNRWKRSFVR